MSDYSPPSLNAASDEENPAQLEKPLYPPTSHEPFGPVRWFAPARFVSSQYAVPVARGATLAPGTTGTDLPIEEERTLFVWLRLATFINFVIFLACLNLIDPIVVTVCYYDYQDGKFHMTEEWSKCVILAIPFQIIWAVISIWIAKREYRLVLLLSIVPAYVFVAYTVAYGSRASLEVKTRCSE